MREELPLIASRITRVWYLKPNLTLLQLLNSVLAPGEDPKTITDLDLVTRLEKAYDR